MSDIFDTLTADGGGGDIFDTLTLEEEGGDIFDTLEYEPPERTQPAPTPPVAQGVIPDDPAAEPSLTQGLPPSAQGVPLDVQPMEPAAPAGQVPYPEEGLTDPGERFVAENKWDYLDTDVGKPTIVPHEWSELERFQRNLQLGGEQVIDSSLQSVRGTIDAIDALNPDEIPGDLSKNIQKFTDASGQQWAEPPEREGLGKTFDELARMAPQFMSTTVAAMAGGVPLAMLAIGSQIAGGTMETLDSQGVDPIRSFQAGMINAAAQSGLEALPIMKALKVWKPGKGALRMVKEMGAVMGAEGVTEFSQSFIESATHIWGKAKKDGKDFHQQLDQFITDLPETAKQGLHEAKIAMLFAGMTTGTVQVVDAFDPKKQMQDKIDDAVATQLDEALKTNSITPEAARILVEEPFLKHLAPHVEDLIKKHGPVGGQKPVEPVKTEEPEKVVATLPGEPVEPAAKDDGLLPKTAHVETHMQKKYKDLYEAGESELPHTEYQAIKDERLTPKALDVILSKDPTKVPQAKAAIADLLGDLEETYKYEGHEEGQAKERYIDSLLNTAMSDKYTKATPAPDIGGVPKDTGKLRVPKGEIDGDIRGYSFAIVKDGNVISSGSIPKMGAKGHEISRIKYYRKLTDTVGGELYLGKTKVPGEIDLSKPLILGRTWQQIVDYQQRKSIPKKVASVLPESAVLIYESSPKGAKADRRTEVRPGEKERRVDVAKRKRVEEMTPEEMTKALKYDEKTGLRNERSYNDAEKLPAQGSMDMDLVKYTNDTHGHPAGDKLFQLVADSFEGDPNVYRVHGDEFYFQGKTEAQIHEMVRKSRAYLKKNPLEIKDAEGKVVDSITGAYSYGVATGTNAKATLKRADLNLLKDKKARTESGERVPRGKKARTVKDTLADTGGYASTGTYDTNTGYFETVNRILELPEIVELLTEITAGKYPVIKRQLVAAGGNALGVFTAAGEGSIRLRADIFKDPDLAAYVLAHEIGHFMDYLPDKLMSRGNILGRMASLKGYLKHSLPNAPGAPGPLTNKDRARMRYQAKKNIEAKGNEVWIDEVIRKESPITADDVMAIWKSTENDINADLLLYVAKLNRAQKKAIMKDALKGVVGAELQKFAKTIETKTGKKIPHKISDEKMRELIREKYADLLNQELEKRKLFDLDDITAELKALTLAWKPFDPKADSRYTQYRFSGPELYADAFSVLINRPGMLKSLAPKFYEGFFNYLDSKPELRDTYSEIQNRLSNPDKVMSNRVKGLKDMQNKGDDAYALAVKQAKRFKEKIIGELFDAHWSIIKKVREIDPSLISPEENPTFKLEDMGYTGSEVEWYLNQVNGKILLPLEKEGLEWNDLGAELFLRRVSADRSDLGNPRGFTPKTAKETLVYLKEHRTDSQNAAVGQAVKEFHKLREYTIDKGEVAERWGPDLLKVIKESKDYATFDVLEYIQKRMGRGPAATISQQIGTLKEVSNPATATILKDIAIIKAINRMSAMDSTVKFLQKFFPTEITPAAVKWDGKRRTIQEPPVGTDQALIILMKKGKPQGYYVDEFIASSFQKNPHEVAALGRSLQALGNPFRKVFTEYNAGFWMFNILRDYFRAAGNLEGAKATTFIKSYMSGIKPAFRSVFGIPDEVTEAMLQRKMLISVENYRGDSSLDTEMERMLKRYHVSPEMWNNKVLKPIGRFLNFYTNVGRAIERVPKVAAYKYLNKTFPDLTEPELRHIVRNTGSPDFLRRGRAYPIYNNILLFSNAIKEGYRGDYEAFSKNKAEWAYKKVKYAMLPKFLMKAATVGVLGPWIAGVMAGVSEYDKTNYNIIPLGITPGGKSVYLRIPIDETGRLIGGVTWKMLNMDDKKFATGLADYMAGQVPTLNPAFGIMADIANYATGGNPQDYQGRPAVPEQIREVGGARSHKRFAKYLANQAGSGAVYRFKNDDVDVIKTELEQMLGYPIASNIIGRFIKVSDQGVKEELREKIDEVRKAGLSDLLDAKDAAHKWVRGEELTSADKLAMAKKIGSMERTIMLAKSKQTGAIFVEAMIRAQGDKEKAEVWKAFLKRKEQLEKAGE